MDADRVYAPYGLTTVDNSKSGSTLSRLDWTLDPAGNPYRVKTTRGGADTYDAHEYDQRGRLTASCFGVASTATNCAGTTDSIGYAYDKVSNRTQEVRTGSVSNPGTIAYAYNAADQLTSTTQGAQSTNYSYDANGNQASIGARSFSYNLANQLVATTSGTSSTTYAYDGDGQRISSTTSAGAELRYTWDPRAQSGIPELALERTSLGVLVRRYLDGPLGPYSFTTGAGALLGKPLAQPGTFYYHSDPLGSVTDVTDATGGAQWRYTYEAFGQGRSATDVSGLAPENRLRFDSQYLDPESGQYHLRARQYDPQTGRFGALDPLASPFSSPYGGAYVYADGRPTVLVDPLGLCSVFQNPIDCAKEAAGAVGDAASSIKDAVVGASKAGAGAVKRTAGAVKDESTSAIRAIGHFGKTHTFGFCINGSAGLILGAVGEGCFAFNLHSIGLTGSLGFGLDFPGGANIGAGPLYTNAHSVSDQSGPFVYFGLNGGEGLQGGANSAVGTTDCNREVHTIEPWLGFGVGSPVSAQAGISNTAALSLSW